jgi:hypothetical protein
MTPGRRRTTLLLSIILAAVGIAVLLLHGYTYWRAWFFADDGFISLRYSERLALGQGLTWTDGERVEGYSNLLWVLLLAGARFLTPDLVTAARILGGVSSAAVIAAVVWTYRPRGWRWILPPLFAVALIALAQPLAAWSGYGLEQPLLAAGLAWAMAETLPLVGKGMPVPRRALAAGVPLAVVVLTRSDGAFFVATYALGLMLAHRLRWRSIVVAAYLVAVPFACWLAQLAFRLAYYGEWVPNTAHAKVAFKQERIDWGIRYLTLDDWHLGPPAILFAVALLALLLPRAPRGRLVLLLTPCLAWAGYLVLIGGDNNPGGRHLVPLVVLGAFVGAELLGYAAHNRWTHAIGVLAAVAVVARLVALQPDLEPRLTTTRRIWMEDGVWTGTLLRRAFESRQPLVAVDAAGALPYYSRLPCLDMLGLSDRWIATHPPPDFGTGWVGHELGDGRYVMRRAPDLVVFSNHVGWHRGAWRSGHEMYAMPEFHRRYRMTTLEAADGTDIVLFVKLDGRVGLTRAAGRVEIPGYLFTERGVVSQLDSQDRLSLVLGAGQRASVSIPLEPGRWSVDIDGHGSVTLSAVDAALEGDLLVMPATGPRDVRLSLASRGHSMVRAVTLTRH